MSFRRYTDGSSEESMSISRVVRSVIISRPSILDCMKMNIINYSALARYIQRHIEKLLSRRVNVNAIKMALIRFSEDIQKREEFLESRIRDVLAKTVISVQTDLVVLTVRREALLGKFEVLLKNIEAARFFQLTQGMRTFTLVIAKEIYEDIVSVIGRDAIVDIIDHQTAIILISPHEIIETPGVIAYITSILSSQGINMTQIISCYEDTILILNRYEALKAYQILEELILKMRERK